MSLHLDCPSQRWLVLCDANCGNKILASEGTHAEQQAELDRLVDAAGWRYANDIGHLCAAHALMLSPPIPRDELCRRDVLCIEKEGHAGRCRVVEKRPMPGPDLTHRTVRKRWG